MTITEFLNARLDEDEAAAHACGDAPWELLPEARQVNVSAEAIRNEKWKYGRMGYVASFEHVENARHVALHDPARVLAEVEAKRAIMSRLVGSGHGVDQGAYGLPGAAWDVLAFLVRPYADHPAYDPAWRA